LRDDGARLRVLEEIAHLPFLVGAVERQVHETRAQAREIEEQRLGTLVDLHRDAIAGRQAQPRQQGSETRAGRLRLAIGDFAPVVEDQERRRAARGETRFEK